MLTPYMHVRVRQNAYRHFFNGLGSQAGSLSGSMARRRFGRTASESPKCPRALNILHATDAATLGRRGSKLMHSFISRGDDTLEQTPKCFGDAAQQYDVSDMAYAQFLDFALSHLDEDHPFRHAEGASSANMAALIRCGPLGPLAAAIKLYMLYPDVHPDAARPEPVSGQDLQWLLQSCEHST